MKTLSFFLWLSLCSNCLASPIGGADAPYQHSITPGLEHEGQPKSPLPLLSSYDALDDREDDDVDPDTRDYIRWDTQAAALRESRTITKLRADTLTSRKKTMIPGLGIDVSAWRFSIGTYMAYGLMIGGFALFGASLLVGLVQLFAR